MARQVLGSGHCHLPYEGDLDKDQHEGVRYTGIWGKRGPSKVRSKRVPRC